MEEVQQLVGNEFVRYQVACITQAYRTFANRTKIDTNQKIVQMLRGEVPIPHFYYRSDNWIDQPFRHSRGLVAYVGPTSGEVPPELRERTFIVDKESTEDIKVALEMAAEGNTLFLDSLLE